MEFIHNVLALLLKGPTLTVLALVNGLAWVNTWGRKPLLGFVYNRILYNNYMSLAEFRSVERMFEEKIPYFAALSDDGRNRFIARAMAFANEKSFVGMNGLKVTRGMKAMVGAAAAQLTFGLDEWRITHLHRILIYPEVFYHRMLDLHLKGGVTEQGTMMLSWADFESGFSTANDNYNLGLHEMAHALKLNGRHAPLYRSDFAGYIDAWITISHPVFTAITTGQQSYLRRYGGTNHHEFFAVCVEHFFESPEDFSKNHPKVFKHLCLLLNQNPLNTQNDYHLVSDELTQASVDESVWQPKHTHGDRFLWQLYAGGIAGFFLFFGVVNGISASISNLTFVLAGVIAIGPVVQHRSYMARHRYLSTPLQWLFGLILVALAMLPAALIALGEYPDAYVGD